MPDHNPLILHQVPAAWAVNVGGASARSNTLNPPRRSSPHGAMKF
jgi:hypothetical protein